MTGGCLETSRTHGRQREIKVGTRTELSWSWQTCSQLRVEVSREAQSSFSKASACFEIFLDLASSKKTGQGEEKEEKGKRVEEKRGEGREKGNGN